MNAAIRMLTGERRWLYQAWERGEAELAESIRAADLPTSRLLSTQMSRLADDICEITDALEMLNAIADGSRRVRLARNG